MDKLETLVRSATEVSFYEHDSGVIACEAWWKDGDKGRKVSYRVGNTAHEAVKNVLDEIKARTGVEV